MPLLERGVAFGERNKIGCARKSQERTICCKKRSRERWAEEKKFFLVLLLDCLFLSIPETGGEGDFQSSRDTSAVEKN